MGSFHQIVIAGHVGKDPEAKELQSGQRVCNFSVAVTDVWYDKTTKDKKENTTWFDIATWGNLAEICAEYVCKGMLVMVAGNVKAKPYKDSDGNACASLVLTAREVKFLSSAQHQDHDDSDVRNDGIPF